MDDCSIILSVNLTLVCSPFQVVVEGNRVNIAGFGTFEPRQRAARKGRNPKTGEEMDIQASTSCGFSAAKQLKNRLNGNE